MWDSLDDAAIALTRDGWERHTAYWWRKTVGNRKIEVELERQSIPGGTLFIPLVHDNTDDTN